MPEVFTGGPSAACDSPANLLQPAEAKEKGRVELLWLPGSESQALVEDKPSKAALDKMLPQDEKIALKNGARVGV
ncbi:hypothetical protein WA026_009589 [Henosepilachna vigintioctopunctata]|uniref:Uncharacterized protein n=1 Tax=Henosepilachna vigintioctopunctata TaxID=420089 RepID=A0AAW1U558_9CUCU